MCTHPSSLSCKHALLLILDLERPERFLKVVFHPNSASWLVWGAHILVVYSVIAFTWLTAGLMLSEKAISDVLWPGLIFATLTAGYSAFLLEQARARDLWHSRLLFPHLVVQSFLAGSIVLAFEALYAGSGRLLQDLLVRCVLSGVVIHGALVLSEVALPHRNRAKAGAIRHMIQGPLAGRFWIAGMLGGVALPIYLLSFYLEHSGHGTGLPVLAATAALLGELSDRIRGLLLAGKRDEIIYHVGRPGHDGYMERVLRSWGIDGHNSHTNICSASARLGYGLWQGFDRPSPDHANARFILLISSHLETGHYFNPHAQRIIQAKLNGAKIAVMDTRLSNTASMADYWLPTYPGTEAAVLLALAKILLEEDMVDRAFVRRWTNWKQFMADEKGRPAAIRARGERLQRTIPACLPGAAGELPC